MRKQYKSLKIKKLQKKIFFDGGSHTMTHFDVPGKQAF